MDTEKLSKWADLLLDTGKRNNLINFKDSKLATVEIVAPSYSFLFKKAEHAATFEIYDPKIDSEIGEDYLEVSLQDNSQDAKLSKQSYISSYANKLKQNQILIYNASGKPMQALKNIGKKAKTAIEETGVNIAYIAFGFVHWFEEESSQIEMRAPILLVPISIEHPSAIDPFYIKVLDDEISLNPTFMYKLQNEYGIKLPTYDEDDEIETYFEEISNLLSKLKWNVTTECKIGLFSFQKINMYKDLKENTEVIIKNNNICAILGEVLECENNVEGKENCTSDLLDLHNVVDADSSQAEAIELVKEGKSFVLQGPPGTGKSQTITNIIAECLIDGKKVLFVSEKLAALNVVYNKLKNVGLEEFCLELHSHKVNKKQVIDELCKTMKLKKNVISTDKVERELKARQEAQKQLDKYTVELHKPRRNINKSLFELYEEVSYCRDTESVDFAIKDIKEKGETYIENAENLLGRFIDYTRSIGEDYHKNVWYGYASDSSYLTIVQLKEDLQKVVEFCKELQVLSENIGEKYKISVNNIKETRILKSFFELAEESEFIKPSLLDAVKIEKVLPQIEQMRNLALEILKNKEKIDKDFDEELYKQNGGAILKKLTKEYTNWFKRLFSKEYKRIFKDLKLCKSTGGRFGYKQAVTVIKTLNNYQNCLKKFNELGVKVNQTFAELQIDVNTNIVMLLEDLLSLKSMLNEYSGLSGLSSIGEETFSLGKVKFKQTAEKFDDLLKTNVEYLDRLSNLFDSKIFNIDSIEFNALIGKLEACLGSTDQLDNWCSFSDLLKKLQEKDLRSFVDYVIERKKDCSQMVMLYKKAFYSQWVDCILHESPLLIELSRIPHDKMIERFKAKDVQNFEINKAKIKAKLSAQRPCLDMIAQGSAPAVLLREGEKKRKKKGVRQLMSEIGELVQTLKPVFLMSPLSVSTYLEADMSFDVVIFDEASQIFPQDAIGAIYRGKQLIVVGDSKQMPPSNFFNSSMDTDDDEDESEDISDFESILDLCSTVFAQCRLKWHYRSKFEQLISFSNKNFYDNDLVTFPSSKADAAGMGVDYFYVDGTFDRKSKTNLAEANRVVDLVFEDIKKYPNRSLGVVAFSISQQNLIERLIYRKRQQNAQFEEFFKADKLEPFFVKNLETVQGDERDTIIFSIAYAKDSQGRLLLNFGPVNREGGERRLNVAVTRAKFNVQLVSSMHHYDIDLSRTKSCGAKLLKEYLDYAENGMIALQREISVDKKDDYDSEFEMEVCEFLRKNGYSVDTQVGCSSFKIDLALKKPNSSNYVLAIECDGATYHSAKTARDRDRLRQQILENMGWKFYRIWSTDWFRNKQIEKQNLLTACKNALENFSEKVTEEIESDDFLEEDTENSFEFPKYEMVDEFEAAKKYHNKPFFVIKEIVDTEAPIAEEWLLRRVAFLFGREKVTNVVRTDFDYCMTNSESCGIIRKNGFLYLKDKEIPMLRVPKDKAQPRDIKYIELNELALGIKEILKQNVCAEKGGLFRLIAQNLGFSRIGDAILEQMEKALKLISSEIEIDGEKITLKS